MSKALDFLVQARPEPMKAYFSFLKQAGSHLDAKTAALISVITKVHAKTPNGLRQYLPRALKAGASADEVIDALLMAMPALGFSKIVWAIDVILEMDLPQFRKYADSPGTAEQTVWREVGDAQQLIEGNPVIFRQGKLSCILARIGGEVVAYDAHCPHKGNVFTDAGLSADTVVCAFHDWAFDLKTGQCKGPGNHPLKKVPVRVENGKVLISSRE